MVFETNFITSPFLFLITHLLTQRFSEACRFIKLKTFRTKWACSCVRQKSCTISEQSLYFSPDSSFLLGLGFILSFLLSSTDFVLWEPLEQGTCYLSHLERLTVAPHSIFSTVIWGLFTLGSETSWKRGKSECTFCRN